MTNAPAALALSPDWVSLTPQQQDVLRPLQGEWDQLDGARKGKWLEIASRYPKLSAENQQRLRERMVEWTRMSPAERQRARIGYQYSGELRSADQQTRLQAKWEAYKALPPEKRQRLAERAAEKASSAQPAGTDRPNLTRAPIQRATMTTNTLGPTVIQARPGATTVLMTQAAPTPAPAASGPMRPLRSPRDARLDPQTLLPRSDRASR